MPATNPRISKETWIKIFLGAACLPLLGCIWFLLTHQAPAATLDVPPDPSALDKRFDAAAATASAVQGMTTFISTLALALTALTGLAVGDAFATMTVRMSVRLAFASLFSYFLLVCLTTCVDIFRVSAIQLDSKVFFLSIVQPLLTQQMEALLMCAGISLALFIARMIWN